MPEWDAVITRLQQVVDERPNEYASDTVANAKDVLRFAMERGWPAPEIGGGYWPTVCIWWKDSGVPDLEVFASSVEVYGLHKQPFDVWDYDHTPGQPFSPEFVGEFLRFDR
jgi:hypothetical protein